MGELGKSVINLYAGDIVDPAQLQSQKVVIHGETVLEGSRRRRSQRRAQEAKARASTTRSSPSSSSRGTATRGTPTTKAKALMAKKHTVHVNDEQEQATAESVAVGDWYLQRQGAMKSLKSERRRLSEVDRLHRRVLEQTAYMEQ